MDDKQLDTLEKAIVPIIVALDAYLAEIDSEDSENQPQIRRTAEGLYGNLKSFLGDLHIHRILQG